MDSLRQWYLLPTEIELWITLTVSTSHNIHTLGKQGNQTLSVCLKHMHARAHVCTHTHVLSVSHTDLHPIFLSIRPIERLSLSLSLSLSHTHTHTHPISLSHRLTPYLSLNQTNRKTLSLSLTHTHTHIHTLSVSHTDLHPIFLSIRPIERLSLSLSHTHTYTPYQSLTQTYTLSFSQSDQ